MWGLCERCERRFYIDRGQTPSASCPVCGSPPVTVVAETSEPEHCRTDPAA